MRLRLTVLGAGIVALLAAPAFGASRQDPSVSFFSGGAEGARASWLHIDDDQTGDGLAIHIVTNTEPTGYAGAYFHHVEGTPTVDFDESLFRLRVDRAGPSFGSPRLEVRFSDGGRGQLRPLAWTTTWQTVGDENEWDNNGGTCGFLFAVTWDAVQACHAGTVITSVVIIADPFDAEFWLDAINVGGTEVFGHAADNDRGNAP